MKKFVFIAALIAATGAMTDTSAQIGKRMCQSYDKGDRTTFCPPKRCVRPHKQNTATVCYDITSTILTVKFLSNSQGGTVDVYRDGVKVAGITANSGTTFSCVLREYGEGNYSVIVSNGNTVIDSKNYTVQ